MSEDTNEFENLDVNEDAPASEFSNVPQQDDLIASGSSGTVYDWNTAPEGVKAPPRVDMDGMTVTINKADIILPPESREWQKSRSGTSEYKYCTFVLHYDHEGQQEFISGCRVFKRDGGKYSHPTITRDRKNQASKLFGLYADFRNKDLNECSLKEFMAFLNSKPKALIKKEVVINPTNEEEINKNFVEKFVE